MIGAEASSRTETGDKPLDTALTRGAPSANDATGIHSNNSSQNVYGKPAALILVNRLSNAPVLKL
jgi:hypothetical protein